MDQPSQSPVFRNKTSKPTYSFFDAIRETIEGKKITRLDWNTNDVYCFLDGYLKIVQAGEACDWIVSDGDIKAIDWVTLPEENEGAVG